MEAVGDTRVAQQLCCNLQLPSKRRDAPQFDIHRGGERRRRRQEET